MEEPIKGSLGKERKRDWEELHGLMKEFMRASILMIRKKGTVTITGVMVGNSKVGGTRTSSMELEYTKTQNKRKQMKQRR